MELFYLILGWLLGILSPLIINRVNRSYSKKELFSGIKTEIIECQFRVLLSAEFLTMKCGKYDKEYLQWFLPYLKNYRGLENIDNLLKHVSLMLTFDDAKIQSVNDYNRLNQEGRGLTMKRFYLPFLESKIGEISFFNIELQNIIYEIKSRLHIVNEEIDLAMNYFQMTFDSSIHDNNKERIKVNLSDKYDSLQKQLIIAVKKIDRCINYKGKI